MSLTENRNTTTDEEPRVRAIKSIWGAAIGGFALCIPLVLFASPFAGAFAILIPLAVAASAGLSTIAVWTLGRRPKDSRDFAAVEAKIQELDQRLGNMELIEATSHKLAARRFEKVVAQVAEPPQGS